jgi:hypothetical protein
MLSERLIPCDRGCAAGGIGPGRRIFDALQQIADVPVGLDEVTAEAHRSRLIDLGSIVEGGHQQDGNLLPARVTAHAAKDVHAAYAWHHQIEHDAVGHEPGVERRQCRLAVAGFFDLMAVTFDHFADDVTGHFVIVHD